MNSEAHHFSAGHAASPAVLLGAFSRRVRNIAGPLRIRVIEWRRRIRSRNELITLTNRALSDMGRTRSDAEQEARKFFWEG